MDSSQSIIDYYTEYDEDSRLDRHPTEFAVTTFILERYIRQGALLDVATGTGRYALHFANRGLKVWAGDIVFKHIEILRSKPHANTLLAGTKVNDACDLSAYVDASFDHVLLMGPVYHLSPPKVVIAIREAVRVLKPLGILIVAYVNRFHGYQDDRHGEWFRYYSSAEILTFLRDMNLAVETLTAIDGPALAELDRLLAPPTAAQPQIQAWLQSKAHSLEDEAALANCIHGLVVARKQT